MQYERRRPRQNQACSVGKSIQLKERLQKESTLFTDFMKEVFSRKDCACNVIEEKFAELLHI